MTTFIDDLEREFWFEAFARHTRSKRFLAFGTPAEFADFCVLQMRERTENRGMKVASPCAPGGAERDGRLLRAGPRTRLPRRRYMRLQTQAF